jgi:hypothetical protein
VLHVIECMPHSPAPPPATRHESVPPWHCQVCSEYGTVKEVIIMRNREDNSSKGAAFVKMEVHPRTHTCACTRPRTRT